MSWFHVDDAAHSGPKFMAATERAIGAWTKLGSWSAQALSDGVVPGFAARRLCTAKGLAEAVQAKIVIRDETADTFTVSGYLKCNPSGDAVRGRRAGTLQRVTKHRGNAVVTLPVTDPVTRYLTPALAPAPDPARDPEPRAGGAVKIQPDLLTLAQTLAAEGNGLGVSVCNRAAKGWVPTYGQRVKLTEIRDQRAARAQRPSPAQTYADRPPAGSRIAPPPPPGGE